MFLGGSLILRDFRELSFFGSFGLPREICNKNIFKTRVYEKYVFSYAKVSSSEFDITHMGLELSDLVQFTVKCWW